MTDPVVKDSDHHVEIQDESVSTDPDIEPLAPSDPQDPDKPAPFDFITENVYISRSLQTSKDRKRAKKMVCDCQFDPEMDDLEDACGETCLNRLLMIECGSRCPCGEYCNNRRFQRASYRQVEVFKTEKKGWGLRATETIQPGTFIMEYCGEVCTPTDFEQRKLDYVREKRRHYYFMSLKTDEILDATRRGNLSRYINHSCDPNCETQKWTVSGQLRIGFFSLRRIEDGEELSFDYKFQRFGDVAQKCYCGSANCRGYLGRTKQTPSALKAVTSRGEIGSPQSPSSRRRGRLHRIQSDADSAFEKEIYDIVGSSWRLKDSDQVIALSRIMLQAETPSQRIMLLQVLQATIDSQCLKRFLSHGLRLLWSWMVDSADQDTAEILQFRLQVLQTLDHLPITTRNQLQDSKVLAVVQRWSEKQPQKIIKTDQPCDNDQASSEASLSSPQQQSQSVENHVETKGTVVVTEADSAACDPVGVVREDEGEGSSCEAEARELSGLSDHSQADDVNDVDPSKELEEKVIAMAEEIIQKWQPLKEVFRIPKRTPQLKKASPDHSQGEESQDNSSEGAEVDDENVISRRKTHTRRDVEPELTWSRKRTTLTPTQKRNSHSHKSRSPHTPPTITHTPPHTITSSLYSGTSTTSYTGFTTGTPVQNTVIVQQPGQSVYVQQQVFQDGCQTTILPSQYVQPSPTTNQQYVQVRQTSLLGPHPQSLLAYSHLAPSLSTSTGTFVQQPGASATAVGLAPLPVRGGALSGNILPPVATQQVQETVGVQQQHQHNQYYTQQSVSSVMTTPTFNTQQQSVHVTPTSSNPLALLPLPPPPPQEDKDLPPNWKTARDPSGKIYYYHSITRKTQWVRPTDKDAEGTITMDLGTPEHEQSDEHEEEKHASVGPRTPTPTSPNIFKSQDRHSPRSRRLQTKSRYSQSPEIRRSRTKSRAATSSSRRSRTPESRRERSKSRRNKSRRSWSSESRGSRSRRYHSPEPRGRYSKFRNSRSPEFRRSRSHSRRVRSRRNRSFTPELRGSRSPISRGPHTPTMDDDSPDGRPCTPDDTPPTTPMIGPRTPPISPGSTPALAAPCPHTPLQDEDTNYLSEDPLPSINQPLGEHHLEQDTLVPMDAESANNPKASSPSKGVQQISENPNLVPDLESTVPSVPDESDTEHIMPGSQMESLPDDTDQALMSTSPDPSDAVLPSSPLQLHSPSPPSPITNTSSLNGVPDDSLETPPPKKRRKTDGKTRSKEHAKKEAFRHKVSKVVTHCLDQHRKSECKYGRITCPDDFKYLARKLTYGLTEKEITRKGDVLKLEFTDSVKSKAKEYIRHYMKKCGPIYKRTKSP